MVNFSGISQKARDGRRKSDLEKIRTALEMARQVGNTYPATAGALVTTNYIQALPTDPKGYSYFYTRDPNKYKYTLDAYVELSSEETGTYGNNCGAPGVCNYRVTNP